MNELEMGSSNLEPLKPAPRGRTKKAAPAVKRTPQEQPKKAPVVVKRVRIILEENDEIPPTGQFFGVNGKSYILRPGEEADVPPELISVLNDAITSTPVIDPSTNQVVSYRPKLRFPYRIISREVA